jgi:hypothetical protein
MLTPERSILCEAPAPPAEDGVLRGGLQPAGPEIVTQIMRIETLRALETQAPLVEGLPSHVSAASGLARCGEWLHVVPDDGLHLATFALAGGPGRLHRLLPDPPLPLDEAERKRRKPDLESLAVLSFRGHPALLAVGSGSTAQRRRGVLQPLYDCGEPDGQPLVFDLGPLYDALPYRQLNIEGLAVLGDAVFLGQRGNSLEASNGLAELDLAGVLRALDEGRPWTPDLLRRTLEVGLGSLGQVRLTLTDLSPWDAEHLLLAAAAEDTSDPYEDGVVVGSILARYRVADGQMVLATVEGSAKIEGIEALPDGSILMVTDADDPQRPALLLRASDTGFGL